MKKVNEKIRYLVSKPQKSGHIIYYWQPAGKLRQHGFLPRRLSNDLAPAQAEAEKLNLELDTWRNGGSEKKDKVIHEGSLLSEIIESYKKDPLFSSKAPATQRIYSQCLDRIDDWAGDQPVKTISRNNIIDFHRALYATKPAFANAIGRQMRIIFEFAHDLGLIESNPARRIKMPSCPPRDQVWSSDDQEKFIKKAEEMGHPSMALAVLIAITTAQRQGDLLRLCWTQFDENVNEIRLKQGKTNRWVSVPILPELRTALENTSAKSEHILCSESTGKNYRPDHFRHLFREIANAAGLDGLQFRDLRRTTIVRLAEAGVSVAGITAISGHDVSHCEAILETYMPRSTEMAREAIKQFESYRKRKAKEQSKIKSWKFRRK